ncbi:DUF3046 domain-containing protein [Corynebacterium pacaense]|uniref:DUF3046 domain-containing protein n=1 Tax=Corynebacterium pacaense TaxID=1816684 RepID=UPI0009BC3C29|nr:DUF3046 domain-containing protein [Corynebacterium pacaense]
MRLSEFRRLVEGEFGPMKGEWLAHSHVLGGLGVTVNEAVERGDDLRELWDRICLDFDVPEERRLGADD